MLRRRTAPVSRERDGLPMDECEETSTHGSRFGGRRRAGFSPEGEKTVRDRVLGERLVAQDRQAQPVGNRPEAVVELRERFGVGGGREPDEVAVREARDPRVSSCRLYQGSPRCQRGFDSLAGFESSPVTVSTTAKRPFCSTTRSTSGFS